MRCMAHYMEPLDGLLCIVSDSILERLAAEMYVSRTHITVT